MQHPSVKLENVITCLKLIILTKETTPSLLPTFHKFLFLFLKWIIQHPIAKPKILLQYILYLYIYLKQSLIKGHSICFQIMEFELNDI
jgi:hypothetical protein